MKKTLLFSLLLIINIYPQSIDENYEIATWQGFRDAAISYSFDDLYASHLSTAVPMFNEFDFQLTLFVVTNWASDWDGLNKAAKNGHEIASHTVTHPNFSSLTNEQQEKELANSQKIINSNVTNQLCATLAYPYCVMGNSDLVNKHYIASRICSGMIEEKTPTDFSAVSSLVCGTLGINTSADFNAKAEQAVRSNGWAVYLIHDLDTSDGYSPLSSDTLRASLEYLKENSDKYWVTSFGNVAKYIKERNSASVEEISNNDNSLVVQITDAMADSLFAVPLSIRRKLPDNWKNVKVKQNENYLEFKIIEKTIQFDAIPDRGKITIINADKF